MSQSDANVLEVEGLTKVFETGTSFRPKKIHAVNHVSFSLKPGHITALVGESGSGKSTIARLIARLIVPTSGVVRVDGQTLTGRIVRRRQLLAFRKNVQMVFQDPFGTLNSHYNIENQLMTPLRNYNFGGSLQERRQLIAETLEAVGLSPASDYLKKLPHELSGGQRQRVVIARALVLKPKLLLADEPTSMLDVSIRISILNLMQKLRDERRVSFLFISHDLASARYLADDIFVMYAGHLIECGSADEIVMNPAHPYTKLLLSAVPDVNNGLTQPEIAVQGEPADLSNLPTGCPFHPRCPMAMDVCRSDAPTRTQVGPSHWTACHLY